MAAGAGGGWSAASAVALHARARRRGPARTGRALLLGAAAAGAALASARAVLREAGRSFAAAGGRPDEGVVQGAGGPRGARRREWLAAAGAAGVAGPTPARASEISVFGANLDLSFLDPKAPEDYNKPPADAEVFPSGLVSKILLRPQCALSKFTPPEKLAKCPKAKPYDKVLIDYSGWKQADGRMFDSSRNEKKSVRVNSVMPAWTEVLPLMSPGESRRVWVPAKLAYGDTPPPNKPAGDLVFDIELYSIDRQEKPPDNLEGPPPDAKFTDSGLGYKVLQAGAGAPPTLESNITAVYSGYETSGAPFMLTSQGAPKTFKVSEIPIKGLLEGVQTMVPGEKRQFWIPPQLAFGEKAAGGLPRGMLVFEFELTGVQ